MESRQIYYFLTVAKEKSITKAAVKLNMTQPPLSRQIKHLEEELGITLFIRGEKELGLTKGGAILYHRGCEILELLELTGKEIGEFRKNERRRISVAAVQSLGTTWLPEIMREYATRFSDVEFNIYIGDSDEIVDKLEKNMFDLGIIREPLAWNKEAYHYMELEKEYWCVLLKKEDPLAAEESVSIEELKQKKLLLPMREEMSRDIQKWLNLDKKQGQAFYYYNDLMTMANLVQAGLGLAIVTPSTGALLKNRNCFVIKCVNGQKCQTSSAIIWKKNGCLSKLAENFIQYMRSRISYNMSAV